MLVNANIYCLLIQTVIGKMGLIHQQNGEMGEHQYIKCSTMCASENATLMLKSSWLHHVVLLNCSTMHHQRTGFQVVILTGTTWRVERKHPHSSVTWSCCFTYDSMKKRIYWFRRMQDQGDPSACTERAKFNTQKFQVQLTGHAVQCDRLVQVTSMSKKYWPFHRCGVIG